MIKLDLRSLALLTAGLAPLVVVSVLGRPISGALGDGVWFALFAAALVCFFVCTHFYLRRLDEAAWEGQKVAWLWGGSFAAVAAVLLAAVPSPVQSFISGAVAQVAARADGSAQGVPTDAAFGLGAVYVLAAQMVGFLIVWIAWWIAKR